MPPNAQRPPVCTGCRGGRKVRGKKTRDILRRRQEDAAVLARLRAEQPGVGTWALRPRRECSDLQGHLLSVGGGGGTVAGPADGAPKHEPEA